MSVQQDNPCLQYPENLGIHTPSSMSPEMAANMLSRAVQIAAIVPFVWSFYDKPSEGQVALIYLQVPNRPFPMDGLRYLENAKRGVVGFSGNRELEATEIKLGFFPGEQYATRIRRTYRIRKGGVPALTGSTAARVNKHVRPSPHLLISSPTSPNIVTHSPIVLLLLLFLILQVSSGPTSAIPPHLEATPARTYSLHRAITDQPAIFVVGDKKGQRIPAGTKFTIPGTDPARIFTLPGPIATAHLYLQDIRSSTTSGPGVVQNSLGPDSGVGCLPGVRVEEEEEDYREDRGWLVDLERRD